MGWLLAGPATAMDMAVRDRINPGLGVPPAGVVRDTPAATWRSFLRLGAAGQFAAAAHCLDLTEVPEKDQAQAGTETARRLYAVLRRAGARPGDVTVDDPDGPKVDGKPINVVVAKRFSIKGVEGEVWLRRTQDGTSGEAFWLFTRRTVSMASLWYEQLVAGTKIEKVELNPGLGPPPPSVKRTDPRSTVKGFLTACEKGDYALAAHYLDLSAIPPAKQPTEGPRLARRLAIVLDRKLWINPAMVSNDPGGAPQAGVPANRQRLGSIPLNGSEADILLEFVNLGSGKIAWVFAPETVAAIEPLYKAYGYGWLGDYLPGFFFTVSAGGIALWQWLAMALMLLAAWLMAGLIAPRLMWLLERGARKTKVEWDDALVAAVGGPLRIGLAALVLLFVLPFLGLSPKGLETAGVLWKLLALVAVAWTLSRWIEVGTSIMGRFARRSANPVAISFLPIFSRVAKILVWILATVVVLDSAGIHVMGLVAGLGIGGLALAFAAQKTIENVFGSLAIATDQPFTVGDYVSLGGVSGTVEDVGLRSTRLRTMARTVVTIPNGTLISERIENFSRRDRFYYNPTLGLVYDSTREQLLYVIDEVKKLLANHPKVHPDVVRVRFMGFGASSLDIVVQCWLTAHNYHEYTALVEELNLAILGIVEASGTGFAFPSQTLYLARDGGIDEERARQAAEAIEHRREEGDLWIPEPPPR